MKAIVLKCKPGSRFHFGKYAPDDNSALNDSDLTMRSDTLFAALINTYQDTFGDAQELVDAFLKGQIKISSVFPCLEQNKQFTWFLPKPISLNLFKTENHKKIKAIKFISKGTWESLNNPVDIETDQDTFKISGDYHFTFLRNEIVLPPNLNKLIEDELYKSIRLSQLVTLPKVLVRETPEEKTVYQVTMTEISNNTGVLNDLFVHNYFLLDTSENLMREVEDKLMSAISLLPETGIGGDRNTTGGLEGIGIEHDWHLDMQHPVSEKRACISLLLPDAKECEGLEYYRFVLRGGRRIGKRNISEMVKPIHLKTVRMLEEGAIVSTGVLGGFADISIEKNMSFLRNGMSINLPIHKQWLPDYE